MIFAPFKESLWKHFAGSIDMLKNCIRLCPQEYWQENRKIFYQVYHCLVFLDYYLTIPPAQFSPGLPFILVPADQVPADGIDDVLPGKEYTQEELLGYLDFCREKCRSLLVGLTEEKMQERWIETPDELAASSTMHFSVFEILLYNLRHVQHHVAQINLLLRQGINQAAAWVSLAEDDLSGQRHFRKTT